MSAAEPAPPLPPQTPVLIVGAGPAGLSLAAQLQRRGIAHCLVDRAGTAASWQHMPEALHLVSPWWTNALAARDLLRHAPFGAVSALDYARYLQTYARRHRLVVHAGVEVRTLRADPEGGYVAVTSQGEIRARNVVAASGYFGAPRPPRPAYPDDGSIPTWHAARIPPMRELRALADARAGAPVLVLGRRISAGQIALALYDAGCKVVLCSRQPLQFRLDGLKGSSKDFAYYFYEELLLRWKPHLQSDSFPVMDGGRIRQLVEAGRIGNAGPITAVAAGVATVDGQALRPAAVIQATGYAPALDWLRPLLDADSSELPACSDWQIDGRPGLFLLGMDNRMNYRSRTLRGIRSDSVRLAAVLQRRLGIA